MVIRNCGTFYFVWIFGDCVVLFLFCEFMGEQMIDFVAGSWTLICVKILNIL